MYGFSIKIVSGETHGASPRNRLQLGPGLALDACGRELLQPDAIQLSFDDLVGIDKEDLKDAPDACWLLNVHYAEQDIDPVTIKEPCSCERREWNHVCETVRYSLRRVDCTQCCNGQPCELDCECTSGPCCEKTPEKDVQTNATNNSEGPSSDALRRGGCRCLCEHLTELQPGEESSRLSEIDDPCVHIRVDLQQGVPLACVRLRRDGCAHWTFDDWIEDCGPRRLVKRNDLLFDLICGCDLTHISWISWAPWHRKSIDRETFKDLFGTPLGDGGNLTRLTVRFSRPVRRETLKGDCFAMRALFHEREGGWREPLFVPIVDVHCDMATSNDLTTEATLIVRSRWVNDAVRGDETRFDIFGARVEIEVRGDYILDCNGQAVDANAVGLASAPTGNGTPGGTFLSTFLVEAPAGFPHQSTQNDSPTQFQGA
ncbi:hypothetical protein Q8F57_000560 [Paraburkholderia terrae]